MCCDFILQPCTIVVRGVASSGEECFDNRWKEGAGLLKDCLGSVMLPIGSLCVGFCVHRALLFKVNAPTQFLFDELITL